MKNDKDEYFISMLDGIIMDSMKEKFFAKYANGAEGFSKPKFAIPEATEEQAAANRRVEIMILEM
jgi:outer membrane protein OmpA-like peptidoglycan-associated protein